MTKSRGRWAKGRPATRTRARVALLLVAAAVVAVTSVPTSAANGARRFTCRASVVRVTGEGPLAAINFEPVIANSAGDPCVAESAGIGTTMLPAGLGSVTVVTAETQLIPLKQASSAAEVANVVLTVPGAPVIEVEVLTSEAGATCPGPTLSSDSTVVGLTIDGAETEVPDGHLDVPLGPVGTLHLNEESTETLPGDPATGDPAGARVTSRALFLDTIVADVVIAEAIANYRGNPCRRV